MAPETFLKSVNVILHYDYDEVYSFMQSITTNHNFSFYKESSTHFLKLFENDDLNIHFICDNCFRKHSKTL